MTGKPTHWCLCVSAGVQVTGCMHRLSLAHELQTQDIGQMTSTGTGFAIEHAKMPAIQYQ